MDLLRDWKCNQTKNVIRRTATKVITTLVISHAFATKVPDAASKEKQRKIKASTVETNFELAVSAMDNRSVLGGYSIP